jgi:hypothetical protein
MDGLKAVPFRPYPLLLQRNQGFSATRLTLHKAERPIFGIPPTQRKACLWDRRSSWTYLPFRCGHHCSQHLSPPAWLGLAGFSCAVSDLSDLRCLRLVIRGFHL